MPYVGRSRAAATLPQSGRSPAGSSREHWSHETSHGGVEHSANGYQVVTEETE